MAVLRVSVCFSSPSIKTLWNRDKFLPSEPRQQLSLIAIISAKYPVHIFHPFGIILFLYCFSAPFSFPLISFEKNIFWMYYSFVPWEASSNAACNKVLQRKFLACVAPVCVRGRIFIAKNWICFHQKFLLCFSCEKMVFTLLYGPLGKTGGLFHGS